MLDLAFCRTCADLFRRQLGVYVVVRTAEERWRIEPDVLGYGSDHAVAVGLSVRGSAETGEIRISTLDWLQPVVYIAVLLLLVKPLGAFMAHVYSGERTFLDRVLAPVERLIYPPLR